MRTIYFMVIFLLLPNLYGMDQVAVTLLKSDLAAFTRPTKREIHVFNQKSILHVNYQKEDWSNRNNNTSLEFLRNLQEEAKGNGQGGMVGPGLYGAPDSFSSGRYTDLYGLPLNYWITHRIKIPPQTNMLDLRGGDRGVYSDGNYFPISDQTLDYLIQVCPSLEKRHTKVRERLTNAQKDNENASFWPVLRREVGGFTYNFFHKGSFVKDPECQKIFSRAMKELNIGVIAYRWKGSHPEECDAHSGKGRNSNTAFLLYNIDLNHENVDSFTSHIPEKMTDEEEQNYKNIHYMTQRNRSPGNSTRSQFGSAYTRWKDNFPELGKDRLANSPEEEYMLTHKFGCSEKYAHDDHFFLYPEKSAEILLKELGTLNVGEIINCDN